MRGWIVLCGALLSLAACRPSPPEAAIASTTGQRVDIDGDRHRLTVKTGQGEMTLSGGQDLALPKGFPADVYLPGGYRVRQVIDMAKATVVTVSVPDASAELIAEAGSAMRSHGWRQAMSSTNANGTGLLVFEKDRRRAAMTFGIHGTSGERVIQVQLTARR